MIHSYCIARWNFLAVFGLPFWLERPFFGVPSVAHMLIFCFYRSSMCFASIEKLVPSAISLLMSYKKQARFVPIGQRNIVRRPVMHGAIPSYETQTVLDRWKSQFGEPFSSEGILYKGLVSLIPRSVADDPKKPSEVAHHVELLSRMTRIGAIKTKADFDKYAQYHEKYNFSQIGLPCKATGRVYVNLGLFLRAVQTLGLNAEIYTLGEFSPVMLMDQTGNVISIAATPQNSSFDSSKAIVWGAD